MTAQDDLRLLASGSTTRPAIRVIANLPDSYFSGRGLTVLSEKARNGDPLVAVALKHPKPFFLDRTADTNIDLWLVDTSKPARQVNAAFIRSVVAINTFMQSVGSTQVWGMVPNSATYLIDQLASVIAAGIGTLTRGEDVSSEAARNVTFYHGSMADWTAHMIARRP